MKLSELKDAVRVQLDLLKERERELEIIGCELLNDSGMADICALFAEGQIETVEDYLFSAVDSCLENEVITLERARRLYEALKVPGFRVESVRQKSAELKRQSKALASWEAGNREVTTHRRIH